MKGNCVIIFFRSLQNLILVNIKKPQNDIYINFKKNYGKKQNKIKPKSSAFPKILTNLSFSFRKPILTSELNLAPEYSFGFQGFTE